MEHTRQVFETLLAGTKERLSEQLPTRDYSIFARQCQDRIVGLYPLYVKGYWNLRRIISETLTSLSGNSTQQVIQFKLLQCELLEYRLANDRLFINSCVLAKQALERFCILLEKIPFRSDAYYFTINDTLLKDFALCTGTLTSTGLLLFEVTNLPRRVIFENYKIIPYIVKHHGFGPFLESHLDAAYLAKFTAEGWCHSYRLAADILRLYPHIKGIIGKSWFYDPLLAAVSPELDFILDFQLGHGARVFTAATSKNDISNALNWSAGRQQSYKNNIYHPQSYIILWDRKSLLRWRQSRCH